jgi:hypothetical protein
MLVEWPIRKLTGYDPEIGGEGYADTWYSLSLEPRFAGVRQVMYGYRVLSMNPNRIIQPDHYKAKYLAELDLPFSMVSAYVTDNESAARALPAT